MHNTKTSTDTIARPQFPLEISMLNSQEISFFFFFPSSDIGKGNFFYHSHIHIIRLFVLDVNLFLQQSWNGLANNTQIFVFYRSSLAHSRTTDGHSWRIRYIRYVIYITFHVTEHLLSAYWSGVRVLYFITSCESRSVNRSLCGSNAKYGRHKSRIGIFLLHFK